MYSANLVQMLSHWLAIIVIQTRQLRERQESALWVVRATALIWLCKIGFCLTRIQSTTWDLMKKLTFPVTAAKLRYHTHLRAKCSNVTRWSSTAAMISRFLELQQFIPKLKMKELNDLMPCQRDLKRIEALNSYRLLCPTRGINLTSIGYYINPPYKGVSISYRYCNTVFHHAPLKYLYYAKEK